MRGLTGRYETSSSSGEDVRAFVPLPLPPQPRLDLTTADHDLIERANRALGRLDGVARLLPDPTLLVYGYIRREAVLSSQIEGTQSSLSDLLLFETEDAPGVPIDDVREVSNYVAAIEYGLERIETLPISIRLLKEVHARLLKGGRGADKTPGELRRTQNWVGGNRPGTALFVPPPPHLVIETLGALELFLQGQPEAFPTLIKAALAHVQFETIHPFLDGNGRLGRLLITLLLCAEGALRQPLLYLSLYFKTHRDQYYALLQRVRTEGVWEEWLRFFLRGVQEVSESAETTARRMLDMFETDRAKIQQELGRKAGSALRLQEHMQRHPIFRIPEAATSLGLSKPTVGTAVDELVKIGLVKEIGQRKRGRQYSYRRYIKLLAEDT